jgi:ATP-dependent Clp protease ATP-binding subunit ClpB
VSAVPSASTRLPEGTPSWLRDIDATLPVVSQYVLHGNIRDLHLMPNGAPVPLADTDQALGWVLAQSGFRFLLKHDPVAGLRLVPALGATPEALEDARTAATTVLDGSPAQLGRAVSAEAMIDVLQRVQRHRTIRGAVMFDYVSQLRSDEQAYPDDVRRLMLAALAELHADIGHVLDGPRRSVIHNSTFWVVDQARDLPTWMVGGSDGIRQVSVPLPEVDDRTGVARLLVPSLPAAPTDQASLTDVVARFADAAEGMSVRAMVQTAQLAGDSETPASRVEDAVRARRVGVTDNHWAKPELRTRILSAEEHLSRSVLGQPRAVKHVADILVRTTLGLTAAHRPAAGGGPRGVLFFAGPTGVGKTELAKQLTGLLFGDERAYVRFDMSEFSAEHTEARLIGSPPGFVGHGSGGELTNAVRQRPFSVVLFDEIEKAHPRILDKFLQILSDGRLTDGSGATVPFGETVIVFTSNLGVAEAERRLATGGPDVQYEQLLMQVIRDEFENPAKFNRPELLGRIGDNLVVFDRLDEDVARDLASRFVDNVVARVHGSTGIRLTIADEVRDRMVHACTRDLSKGGRGIGLNVESLVVNPLARTLADRTDTDHATLVDFRVEDGAGVVVLS